MGGVSRVFLHLPFKELNWTGCTCRGLCIDQARVGGFRFRNVDELALARAQHDGPEEAVRSDDKRSSSDEKRNSSELVEKVL